jgi:hypothetical protein
MSEVSESLHLWLAKPKDARRLAVANDIAVRILGTNERWTTLVPLEDDEVEAAAEAAPGLCLHWRYFDDFGLWLAFREDGQDIGTLSWEWQETRTANESSGLLERLSVLGILSSTTTLALVDRFTSSHSDGRTLRNHVASTLGLPAHEWLSPQYCRSLSIEDERKRHPDAEDVDVP